MSPEKFAEGLNDAQRAAVVHGDGPLLVLAGAGSGKTRVITMRIARLLASGVPASAILAVTFTNKAAEEMLERVIALTGARAAQGLTVSTFHSFGLGFLQREARYLGFGAGFTIFDQSDAVGTIRELMRNLHVDGERRSTQDDRAGGRRLDAAAILNRISLAKNAFETPESMPDGGDLDGEAALYQAAAKVIYGKYIAALRGFHALDFDDLICEPVRLLEKFPELRDKWQRKFRYVLVDEYQDTNKAQLELLRLVVGAHKNITVVGDDDQSIYAWRGADVTNILSFEEHFPGARVVKLEQNYRSRAPVLEAANAVIGNMPNKKYKKELFTTKTGGDMLQLVTCALPEVEASFVASEADRLIKDGRSPSQIAVIYRSNKQAELIEQALRERGVAYVLIGGQTFFERKEVKDLLSYLKLAVHPLDEISLRRVINYPARGIGEQALHRLEAYAIARDVPLFHGRPPAVVARELSEKIRLKEDLWAGSASGTAAEKRWGNVESLFRSLDRYWQRAEDSAWDLEARRTPSIAEFLHRMTLRFGDEEEQKTEVVTLTTLHGAKGLEYDVVFLIGLEEGILPHKRTLDPKATDIVDFKTDESGAAVLVEDGIDEERRLFYVGVTRAKERLYLCRSRARSSRGAPAARLPSRFLADVPNHLVEIREVTEVVRQSPEQMRERTAKALAGFGGRPKF
ncbi:MAG: UvrD-helicase domain-containing protein [Deltaproteobacteria bacterium]|nr:UvrD-helicase domain-containing protein [Deltaproteobacteria bacterium]